MQIILNPCDISCLLFYYTRNSKDDIALAGSNDYGINKLLDTGLIEEISTSYIITHRGIAHVFQLMNAKIPTKVYLIPHQEEEIIRHGDTI